MPAATDPKEETQAEADGQNVKSAGARGQKASLSQETPEEEAA